MLRAPARPPFTRQHNELANKQNGNRHDQDQDHDQEDVAMASIRRTRDSKHMQVSHNASY